ncbi:MAG: beta-ketoacyl-[acyl-carrier-protein] synthase family protein [Sulfurimicrobium sp.]|nr:beta-ketoacyl-[acyl-carrier-protein] synthase family protein [Sulfurimicrobium sp.]MDP1704174.1 beta-ketoacyl-[acyl-carrier-protein] synthase family protein [Sulfurimicrobium sp.]MDP1896419.1 beta-ketoacyl-[acyl-carrier-protein] synthase family protein [Sulfurimicrobium sp.]MDP2199499.1 beta-ketoacyl-[acyl-carrier-protein] synthase family protein [Sulfurimicrobium sp.]MDP3688555.1 beta-ketoacyl-[acyl-carrier-protein] synthase family protein [Sulfurimicrobium sp.]
MTPISITHYTLTSALGHGKAATLAALQADRSGLRPNDFADAPLETYIGRVDGIDEISLPRDLAGFDCRNNRLAQLCLELDGFAAAVAGARERHGPKRIAVILGTSTSGILETEHAYRRRDPASGALPDGFHYAETQSMHSAAEFVRRYLALGGPAFVISTACSSSAKVFASASRLIQSGLCDAAVVGGVDSLCSMTLYGFNALQLVSSQPCRPCDPERNGISIGEGAGFFLLEKHPLPNPLPLAGEGAMAGGDLINLAPFAPLALLGYGESSDAYHMSTPHPEGLGAALAMEQALSRAGLNPQQVDYINMHGTSSRSNDSAEDKGMQRVFGTGTPCSSTKGATGHTLGAAGAVEAAIACLSLEHGIIPGTCNTQTLDPELGSAIQLQHSSRKLRRVMSNSFGFGGNNCSLIFGTQP